LRDDMADWMDYMRRGDFSAAWNISDRVMRARAAIPCAHRPRHEQWIWNGAPLNDKRVARPVLSRLGDTVQYIRYAPMLKEIARALYVLGTTGAHSAAPPRSAASDTLLPLHDGAPDIEYDADVEIMELPHVFRTTLDTIPRDFSIHRGAARRARARYRDAWRRCRVVRGRGRARPPRARSADQRRLLSPRNLAGALGRPVWTLLHNESDWRWMNARDDTPWYPTMRLFRQPSAGNWMAVVDRVVCDVKNYSAATSSTSQIA